MYGSETALNCPDYRALGSAATGPVANIVEIGIGTPGWNSAPDAEVTEGTDIGSAAFGAGFTELKTDHCQWFGARSLKINLCMSLSRKWVFASEETSCSTQAQFHRVGA